MDPHRFDGLVRSLVQPASRRRSLSMLVGGALAALGAGRLGLAPDVAAGKTSGKSSAKAHANAHGKGHDTVNGQTGGTSPTTAAGHGQGAPKKKHHHHHHPPPPGGGTCTTNPVGGQGSAVTQTSQTSFNGQILQATQTVQPVGANHATASRIDLTLAGAPLLTIATTGQDGSVTVTLTYGAAFQGIQRARFVNDGTTITGDVDGRAIVPLPATSDPSKTRFADGAPPPDVQVDKDLAKAIQTLQQQAQQAAKTCQPTPAGSAASRKSKAGRHAKATRRGLRPADHPEQAAGCLALYVPCGTADAACIYGAGVGCIASLFFYGACLLGALAICEYAALVCRKGVRVGSTCCPVPCGGSTDVANPFSDDPSCCEHGETCANPDSNQSGCCPPGTNACVGVNCCKPDETCQSNGQCCAAGASLCGEVCCPNGSCQDGQCCEFPNVTCGTACCAPLSSCCAGQCCTGICTNGICCVAPAKYCNGSCCANNCCNGVCCAAGQGCGPNGSCATICGAREYACPNFPGNPPCCFKGAGLSQTQECCPGVAATATAGAGCCDIGLHCCSQGTAPNLCKTNCLG